jgi:ABC-type phosphate transport system substrate-binding protein
MTLLSARRVVSACILSAAAVAAVVAPSAANAGTLGKQCSGENITGQGSSLQKLAQQNVWTPNFITSANAKACNGTQGSKGIPTVTYTSVGSGAGMEAWGINGHAFEGTNGYVGTDEPPNEKQREEIQSHSSAPSTSTLETIPVIQGSVAIIVHLPTGCKATSISNPGRLVFDNVTLEKIWSGAITKWSQITENGDAISGLTKSSKCNTESAITRVVRKDQSGTTSIFKKYLYLIDQEPVDGELTWRQISEEKPNVEDWPGVVTRPSGTGGGEEVKMVGETQSSIGYANLADARSNATFYPPTGGKDKGTFWAPVQDNGLEQEGEKYADPSTNLEAKEKASANCANTEYTNGETSFPPASTLDVWNEVTTRTTEPKYPLCGLSYDLTFTEYSKYPGTSLRQATTANNYLIWVLQTSVGGGQALIKTKEDYLGLPSSLEGEAKKGAEATKF